MGTAERRIRIMRLLCRRRYETIANIAQELGVSTRTIRRDIDELSLTEPIYTQTGRYGGGVYVMDNYNMDRMYMDDNELSVLTKLSEQAHDLITPEEMRTLKSIIEQYSKPDVQ